MLFREWVSRKSIASAAGLMLMLVLVGCSKPEPETGTLIVTSTPEGASIMVDGIDYGQTPAHITGLTLGEHYVILMDPDHDRLNHRISLESTEPLSVDLTMKHHTGQIAVTTSPIGAEVVLINEKGETQDLGITPMPAKPVLTGTYTYEVRLTNFYPVQKELKVENGGIYTFHHTLDAMEATVRVFSRPTSANIYVNDVKRKETTPATLTLIPGEYTVGVHMDGYMMNEKTVALAPNTTVDVSADLKEGNMPVGMVLVPAGPFPFGDDNKSPDEKPRSMENLPAFYIDKYEVTNEEFKAVFPTHPVEEGREDFPVRGVTWKQAADYAAAVGKRLPTEREWEKAARGDKGLEYPWGNVFDPNLVVYADGLTQDTRRTGSRRKGVSPYGCFDMAGNVYEWVDDWYNPYPGNAEVTINYGTIYRVLRGGSYKSDQFNVRTAKRHYAKPDVKHEEYGFRCAMDAE